LLLPVAVRALHAGRRITCISNLRQLGLAAQLYENNNDGRFPVAVPRYEISFGVNGKKHSYNDPLTPYGMTTEIYHCPDARIADRDAFERSDYEIRFVLHPVRLDSHVTEAWALQPENSTV